MVTATTAQVRGFYLDDGVTGDFLQQWSELFLVIRELKYKNNIS